MTSSGAELVDELRAAGYSWHVIARALNDRRISTPTGTGQWWAASAMRHYDPVHREQWRRYIAARRAGHGR